MKLTKTTRTALVGRLGAEATLALRNRNGGPMADRRTRRLRTRAAQKRSAIAEGRG